jgi:hypothetical protein
MSCEFRALAVITDEDGYVRATALPVKIVWQNPLCLVMAKAET